MSLFFINVVAAETPSSGEHVSARQGGEEAALPLNMIPEENENSDTRITLISEPYENNTHAYLPINQQK